MWAHLATALANEEGLAGYEVHEVRSKSVVVVSASYLLAHPKSTTW